MCGIEMKILSHEMAHATIEIKGKTTKLIKHEELGHCGDEASLATCKYYKWK